jgi:hypothetical protein
MLDLSRRLRMDEARPTVPQPGICERLGFDAAPTGVADETSLIVFSGDEKQVREGFAIALHAMGVAANFLPANIPLSTIRPNREDN